MLPPPRAFQPLGVQGLVGTANAFAAKRMPLTLRQEPTDVFFPAQLLMASSRLFMR